MTAERATNFDFEKANALMAQWLERQGKAFQAMASRFDQAGRIDQAAELWRSYMEFWTTLSSVLPAQAGAIEASTDSLVAPAAGAPAGRGLESLVDRAIDSPGFALLWDWDRKSLRSYGTWLEMRNAAAAHRALLDKAWKEAHGRFLAALARPAGEGGPAIDSWRKGLELWFETANQCLLETQRSDEFLQAQKRLLRSAMEYRLSLRELAEEFCEAHQIPGRGEIDDLSRTVHELRRELRALKRRVAEEQV